MPVVFAMGRGAPGITRDGIGPAMVKQAAPYTLVLAGGGARGFAHVGVLRGLEVAGYPPSAIVGVSMGAVVAAAYALDRTWYADLTRMDAGALFGQGVLWENARGGPTGFVDRVRNARTMWRILRGWGVGEEVRTAAGDFLRRLMGDRDLRDGRIPVAVCATDLRTGARIVLDRGRAAEAVYASSALAGVVPPLEKEGRLLCDGAYADLVPVDVARRIGPRPVVAVNPQQRPARDGIRNGFEALIRAVEICHLRHADLRFVEADVVIRPRFRRPIDVLEFGARRECIAAGLRAVRAGGGSLARRLGTASFRRAATGPPPGIPPP